MASRDHRGPNVLINSVDSVSVLWMPCHALSATSKSNPANRYVRATAISQLTVCLELVDGRCLRLLRNGSLDDRSGRGYH
jgi:hypothetical protein